MKCLFQNWIVMLLSEIYTLLGSYVVAVINNSAVTIAYAYQNAPRPIKPFILISS